MSFGCILSKFYIKPQHCNSLICCCVCCILSKFYIKPQLITKNSNSWICCILSKPQHSFDRFFLFCVVSYRNSTSNHNTSSSEAVAYELYLIEILHQTTTEALVIVTGWRLYLIEILHQTTTSRLAAAALRCCILSKFYIKPQLLAWFSDEVAVVSYRNSTSNHNSSTYSNTRKSLYLIEILHQTTTRCKTSNCR